MICYRMHVHMPVTPKQEHRGDFNDEHENENEGSDSISFTNSHSAGRRAFIYSLVILMHHVSVLALHYYL